MMKKILLTVTVLAGVLSGCSTPGYECELKVNETGKCASMTEAYKAANTTIGSNVKRESVFESSGDQHTSKPTSPSYFEGTVSSFPDQNENGMPVFKQPEVHRVWVAPYVDADGNLRTGEYTYFTTPGEWNYGTTKRTGQASGIFGPAKLGSQGNQGFIAEQKKVTAPLQAPPQPNIPGETSGTKDKNSDKVPNVSGLNGVTQPSQKF